MKVKVFKNNNLHVKFDKNDLEEFKKSNLSDFEFIFYNLDLLPVGEEYCINNFDMAVDVTYNGGFNFYRFNYSFIDKLLSGQLLILKPLSKKYIEDFLKEWFEE